MRSLSLKFRVLGLKSFEARIDLSRQSMWVHLHRRFQNQSQCCEVARTKLHVASCSRMFPPEGSGGGGGEPLWEGAASDEDWQERGTVFWLLVRGSAAPDKDLSGGFLGVPSRHGRKVLGYPYGSSPRRATCTCDPAGFHWHGLA